MGRWMRLVGLVLILVGVFFVVPIRDDPPGGLLLHTATAVLLLGCLALVVVAQLRRSIRDQRRTDGLVGSIVAVLLVFALAFYALAVHRPDELTGIRTRLDALYFSASTMMTIGYGDVHANGQTARALVLVQMVFDAVFVAAAAGLLTARLRRVAAAHAQRTTDHEPEEGPPTERPRPRPGTPGSPARGDAAGGSADPD